MDKKLLDALNNIGDALDALVDALANKAESTSEATTALKSGDFGKQLESISIDIKSIKADTQEIIKNQQTILGTAKKKEADSKLGVMDSLGGDKDMMTNVTKGIGVILLLAVAVLAIGMAFKLVGGVDILSVIGLALGITIISLAFEKIASLKLGLKEAFVVSSVMIIMSTALMISSYVLSIVSVISPAKMLTAIMIGAGFAIIGISINKMISAFKGVNFLTLAKSIIFLPLILPAIALGIALSSRYLSEVRPIGLAQAFSSVLIAGVFAVVSFGMKNMLNAFSGISPVYILLAAAFLPTILVSMSQAIADSSESLSRVKMMGLGSFFGSVMVSLIFVVLSLGIKKIINSFKGIDPATAAIAAISIPIIMVAMSAAIWGSSELLSKVVPIGFDQFLTSLGISVVFIALSFAAKQIIKSSSDLKTSDIVNIPILFVTLSAAIWLSSIILDKMTIVSSDKLINAGLIGAGLAILSIALVPSIKVLSKIGIGDIIKGAMIIPIIALTVMISSHILALGNYEKYPPLKWTLGVAAAMIPFGIAMSVLGGIAMSGVGALAILAGAGMVLVVAGTVVAASHILKKGNYSNYPGLDWSLGVSLSMGAFALGMTTLGAIIFGTFGIGGAMLAAGAGAVLMVAKTIVSASNILANGYTDKDGITFKPNYTGGPTKEWAEGVSIALGAFSPVYGMLMKNAIFSLFGSGGVGPEDFTKAIKTVSEGIVTAAEFFANNKSVFKLGPSKEWAEGVGTAIGAFAPVFEVLMKNSGFWKSGDSVIKDMTNGITGITKAIVSVGRIFENSKLTWESYPSENWGINVEKIVKKFTDISKYLDKTDSPYWKVTSVINRIKGVAGILFNNKELFTNTIDPNFMKNMGQNILDFNEIVKSLVQSEGEGKGMWDSAASFASGLVGSDPISQIAKRMVTLADGYDKLANSLTKLGVAMKMLNISDARMLGGITRSIISPEESNSINQSLTGQTPSVEKGDTSLLENFFKKKEDNIDTSEEPIGKKMDTVISLLTSINNNTININQFIEDSTDGRIEPPVIV
jgi:hypothetical protein